MRCQLWRDNCWNKTDSGLTFIVLANEIDRMERRFIKLTFIILSAFCLNFEFDFRVGRFII